MRWPIGSLSEDFAAARCQPVTEGFSAPSRSRPRRCSARGTIAEKYAAAASTSASVTSLDSAIMNFGGSRSGTEVARAPLRKSAICWTMYAAGRPWRLLFSGPPGPSARWQKPHAKNRASCRAQPLPASAGDRRGANRVQKTGHAPASA